jgi:hypothetical protein
MLGGLFGGSGGSAQAQTTNTQQNTSTQYPQWYDDYTRSTLQRAQEAAAKPRESYDTSKMFAPLNNDQQVAFANIRANPAVFANYANRATGALDAVNAYDPTAAARPALDEAGRSIRPWDAGSANIGASAQGWNDPRVQASYTDPYIGGAIGRANDITTRDFLQKTMPGITSQFAKGTGQLGRGNYNTMTGRAIRDFSNEMSGNDLSMMDKAYWQGAGQFNSDQARRQAAGVAQGNLANTNMGALRDLGIANANVTTQGVQSGINKGDAYLRLGQGINTTNLANAGALRDVGNQEQQQAQLPLTADYQNWLAQQQYPFQMVNFLNSAARGFQIPQTTSGNTQTTQDSTGTSSGTPSVAGSILGTAGAINTLGSSTSPVVTDASGKTTGGQTTGGLSNIYNWGKGLFNSSPDQATVARGGRIKPRKARGGALSRRDFDVGGTVPVTRGVRARNKPKLPMGPPPMGMAPPGPFSGPPGGALPPMPPMGPPRGALGMVR